MPSFLPAAVLAAACLLTACASQAPRTVQAPLSAARVADPAARRIVTDTDYVARVEREARRRGLGVQWINPPVRRTRD